MYTYTTKHNMSTTKRSNVSSDGPRPKKARHTPSILARMPDVLRRVILEMLPTPRQRHQERYNNVMRQLLDCGFDFTHSMYMEEACDYHTDDMRDFPTYEEWRTNSYDGFPSDAYNL